MSEIRISSKKLITLKGQKIPEVVDGLFMCDFNYLTSLEFGPKEVKGNFWCNNNHLTSLEFGPTKVDGHYNCYENQLTSLEYCATGKLAIFLCNTNKLTSLEFCPIEIEEELGCSRNLITNLKGIHKQFKNGYIGNTLRLSHNPLKSHLLGVILIPRLQKIQSTTDRDLEQIINKHLKERDVLECQEELIQNGLKEFAQL